MDHLEFDEPDVSKYEERVRFLQELLNSDEPHGLDLSQIENAIGYYEEQMMIVINETIEANSSRLAEAIIHKFHKYGTDRFGPKTKVDFYDGLPAYCGTEISHVYDETFLAIFNRVAKAYGLDGDFILSNMRLGKASAERFSNFITVYI